MLRRDHGAIEQATSPLLLALGGLIALAAALGVGRFVYTPILPFMVEDLGLSKSEAGLIASANFLGYLLGALAAGLSVVRGSKRRWLLFSVFVSAVTTVLSGLTAHLGLIVVIRFLGGAASAFVMVFVSTLILERLASAGRSDLSAVHFAGVGLGIAISAVLVSTLAAHGLGWREQWQASGCLALLALFAVALLVPDRADQQHAARPGGPSPGLAGLITAYGLFGFGYVITGTFIVAIVRASPAIAPLETSIWAVVGLCAAPSLWLWTVIARRIGILQAFAVAAVAEAIGVASSVLWVTPAGMILAGALLGGTFMGLTALGLIAARRMTEGDPRRVLAQMTAAFGLGQIVGPSLAGYFFDMSGSFLGASLIATVALVAAALLALRAAALAGSQAAGL
ncbi:MAG: YbfB/YjiJ family MFS transporter [Alphaproteobacteria bacterium]